MTHYVYFLQMKDGRIYVGETGDLERREDEHHRGIGGRTTTVFGAGRIIYSEIHLTRTSALKRERQLKGWTRAKKLALARGGIKELRSHTRSRSRHGRASDR